MEKYNHFKAMGVFLLGCCCQLAQAQNTAPMISVRISGQADFQKAIYFGGITDPSLKHSTTTINGGIDLLVEKHLVKNLSAYAGIGYFRNRFNFKRGVNHQLLNIGTDSIGIYTRASNYTYDLFRLPLGFIYRLKSTGKYLFSVSAEELVNFSFRQVYKGSKPFPGANDSYSHFQYYGNSILFGFGIAKKIPNGSLLQLNVYTRILNMYRRNDQFLYESDDEPHSGIFDGVGLSVIYSFWLKK